MSVQNIDFKNHLGQLAIKEMRVAYNHTKPATPQSLRSEADSRYLSKGLMV